jgi:hypothetical protein
MQATALRHRPREEGILQQRPDLLVNRQTPVLAITAINLCIDDRRVNRLEQILCLASRNGHGMRPSQRPYASGSPRRRWPRVRTDGRQSPLTCTLTAPQTALTIISINPLAVVAVLTFAA